MAFGWRRRPAADVGVDEPDPGRGQVEADTGLVAVHLGINSLNQLPAAVAVKEGINLPRYPTLKTRMSAKKLPVEKIAVEPEPGAQSKVRLETPPTKASSVEVLGHGPDAAGAVVDVLEELGILG